jgi:hypothetical protein
MITLVVAVLALVVGLAAVVLAALALGRSSEATDLATKANAKALPPTAGTASPGPTAATTATEPDPTATATDPQPGPTTTPTDISPSAQFTIAYEDQHLRPRSPSCGYADNTYVDLDEPRITAGQGANSEFGYHGCNPGGLDINLPFAEVSGPSATPKDCLEAIRTDPGHSPIAPTRGMTICIVTDQNAAVAQGISQKLAFVTVDAVSKEGDLGVLNLTVKAWAVPS